MNRRILSSMILFAILATLSVVCVNCSKDTTAPSIYFLAKDGKTIDKKGDTVVLLYTKYVDPGCYVEDNASDSAEITVTSDLENVLQLEGKVTSHIGEIKKTGDYTVTYTATDKDNNSATRPKVISCRNVSDIYNGKYLTVREEITGSGTVSSDICEPAKYYSNITASNNVAGRIRFSKVALHEHDGQKVSFKLDADLYSPENSPSSLSAQIGYLGLRDNKEKVMYDGMSYDAAVDAIKYKYVYLQITTQEYVAYTEGDAAINEYKVTIKGNMDGQTPKSKIVYNENGVMLYIELSLNISVPNASGTGQQSLQNYVERYYLE